MVPSESGRLFTFPISPADEAISSIGKIPGNSLAGPNPFLLNCSGLGALSGQLCVFP